MHANLLAQSIVRWSTHHVQLHRPLRGCVLLRVKFADVGWFAPSVHGVKRIHETCRE